MNGNEAVEATVRALQRAGIPFMLVGSYSSNFYGIPRSTKDADVVVQLGGRDLERLADALPAGIEMDAQMSFETVTGTLRHILLVPGTAFKIELFLLSDDEHDQTRFARRREEEPWPGFVTSLPSPEDVIIQKLRWSKRGKRSKDFDDAVGVLAVQGQALDFPYLETWCARHGTTALLTEAREAARLE